MLSHFSDQGTYFVWSFALGSHPNNKASNLRICCFASQHALHGPRALLLRKFVTRNQATKQLRPGEIGAHGKLTGASDPALQLLAHAHR